MVGKTDNEEEEDVEPPIPKPEYRSPSLPLLLAVLLISNTWIVDQIKSIDIPQRWLDR